MILCICDESNTLRRRNERMKKEKRLRKIIEKIAVRAAKEDANTVCPFLTYQPVQPSSVKKLRKF